MLTRICSALCRCALATFCGRAPTYTLPSLPADSACFLHLASIKSACMRTCEFGSLDWRWCRLGCLRAVPAGPVRDVLSSSVLGPGVPFHSMDLLLVALHFTAASLSRSCGIHLYRALCCHVTRQRCCFGALIMSCHRFRESVSAYEDAVRLDPQLSTAQEALADARAMLTRHGINQPSCSPFLPC